MTTTRYHCEPSTVEWSTITASEWPAEVQCHPLEDACIFPNCDESHVDELDCKRCGHRCSVQCLNETLTERNAAPFLVHRSNWVCPICAWLMSKGDRLLPSKIVCQEEEVHNEKRSIDEADWAGIKRIKTDIRRVTTWGTTIDNAVALEAMSVKLDTRYGPFLERARDAPTRESTHESRVLNEAIQALLPVAYRSSDVRDSLQVMVTRLEALRLSRHGLSQEAVIAFQESLNAVGHAEITAMKFRSALLEADSADRRSKAKSVKTEAFRLSKGGKSRHSQ